MMARLQEPQEKKRFRRKRLTLLIVVILPLLIGATIWVLSVQGLITGSWSGVFGAIFTAVGAVFTVIGVIYTLFQPHQPPLDEVPSISANASTRQRHMLRVRTRLETTLGASKRKGSLIVLGNRRLSGVTIHICHGFDQNGIPAEMASNIVLRMVDGSPTYAAVFPTLKPGNYTVSAHPQGPRANVTIRAGQIEEIDWRLYMPGRTSVL